MQRTILHVDGDAFYVAVERVFDPRLRSKAVVVTGSLRGRSAVLSASYEARGYGVRAGMPASHARRVCPDAVWVKGDAGRYLTASRMFMQILEPYSPCVESEAMGQSYMDMTGCRRLHGHPLVVADRLQRQMLQSLQMSVSIGIAATRLAARLASGMAKPGGILQVLPGCEAAFLAAFPVGFLPGLTAKTERQLLLLGIRSLGDLGRLEPMQIQAVLGVKGLELRAMARAEDEAGVRGSAEKENPIRQEFVFESEVIEDEALFQALSELVAKGCMKCRQLGYKCRRVTLQIGYGDLQRVVRSQPLEIATDLDLAVFSATRQLMKQMHTRRVAVRILGLVLADFVREQLLPLPFSISEADNRRRFYKGLDAVRKRFGFGSLASAGVLAMRGKLAGMDSAGGGP